MLTYRMERSRSRVRVGSCEKSAKEESIDPSLTRKAKDNPDFLIELVQL